MDKGSPKKSHGEALRPEKNFMPIIKVANLSKSYTSWKKQPGFLGTLKSIGHREKITVDAVKDVSFSINEGELVGFIGPNGAGKTTTLKMLSGILWPTSGEASVMGHVPWKREREFQQHFAIVLGQKNQLWWDLPAKDSFLLNKEIYQITKADFDARLKQFGQMLDVERLFTIPVNRLSLGERMKCELINALLHEPRVLFLDEPTIGLDVVSQQAIREFLKTWNKQEGATIILTSHAMADVQALCERVIVINDGSIKYDGALAELVKSVADHKEMTVTFSEAVTREVLKGFGKIRTFSGVQATIHVERDQVRDVAKRLLEQLPVVDLNIQEISIDEVVRKIFKR